MNRLAMTRTAAMPGFQLNALPVLPGARQFKALGNPTGNTPKYFVAVNIEARARDAPLASPEHEHRPGALAAEELAATSFDPDWHHRQ